MAKFDCIFKGIHQLIHIFIIFMDFDRPLIITFSMKNMFHIVLVMPDWLRNLKISRETPVAVEMTIVI